MPVEEPKPIAAPPPPPPPAPPAPVIEPPRPVIQPSRPAPEPTRPIFEPARPVPEPPRPVAEPPRPIFEPPRPVAEPSRPIFESSRPIFEPPRAVVEPRPVVAEPPPAVEEAPSIAERIAEGARDAAPSIGRWLAIAAGIGVLGVGAWIGAPYARQALTSVSSLTDRKPAEESAPVKKASANPTLGELHVTSTPDGAHVLVDGKDRGVTPLTVSDLKPGAHEVTIASSAGTIRRSVTLGAGEAADIDESIFPGFVAVLAPFDVEISENGHALSPDERGQFLLAPGVHDLRLANRALNYSTRQQVEVKPGATTPVRVTPPTSTLTVTSGEAAEVFLDGTKVGDTPLNAVSAPLGTHEIVVKRASGEKRFTVTIGASPFTLNADSDR